MYISTQKQKEKKPDVAWRMGSCWGQDKRLPYFRTSSLKGWSSQQNHVGTNTYLHASLSSLPLLLPIVELYVQVDTNF